MVGWDAQERAFMKFSACIRKFSSSGRYRLMRMTLSSTQPASLDHSLAAAEPQPTKQRHARECFRPMTVHEGVA
jgi:hypothetical protein